MMTEITCNIIRDLLPSYADGIAGEDTRRAVEEHIASCGECRAALESMRGAEPERTDGAREIDFLKKNRRRNRRIVIFSVLAACLAAALFIALKIFVIGEVSDGENIGVRVNVDGRNVRAEAQAFDSAAAIRGFEFVEKDGVLTVRVRTVLVGLFTSGRAEGEYEAENEIERVIYSNSVIWKKEKTASVFSQALKNELTANWRKWNSMSETERMLSSSTPGHIIQRFGTWSEAVGYLGFEPFNPLEDCRWLENMNYCGTDVVTDPEKGLQHAYIYVVGGEDGTPQYAELTAGYRLLPDSGETTDVTSASAPEELRVTYTAEPLIRVSDGTDEAAERRELASGAVILLRISSFDGGNTAEILFDADGVHCTVRVTGKTASAVRSGAERIIGLIAEKL